MQHQVLQSADACSHFLMQVLTLDQPWHGRLLHGRKTPMTTNEELEQRHC